MKSIIGVTISLFTTLILSGGGAAVAAEGAKIKIVTSVAPITNIVRNVGGANVEVTGIVPDGMDSHTFEPAPSDAKLLNHADIIIINGLGLETSTVKLADKVKKKSTAIVSLGDAAISRSERVFEFGHINPHAWPNIALAMRYAEGARDALIKLDPARRDSYIANTSAYLEKLRKLDVATFECVKSIPEKNRKLVTYHDSFAYFAPRYGMKIIAAIQPSDFSEPSPREIIRIIEQLKKEKVPAIFGSEVFPSKILEQIARETGVKFIDQLSDDELPAPPKNSFIGMMVVNLAVMTEALGGQPTCVANVDAANLLP